MSTAMKRAENLLHMLPEEDLDLTNEFLSRLVKSWDPDFTKVTPAEKKRIDEAEKELAQGEYYTDEDVWN